MMELILAFAAGMIVMDFYVGLAYGHSTDALVSF